MKNLDSLAFKKEFDKIDQTSSFPAPLEKTAL
jgi:hypothetical protein